MGEVYRARDAKLDRDVAIKVLPTSDQLRATPKLTQQRALLGLMLAYLGRNEEAIREGERAVELAPVAKDGESGPYVLFVLVRIDIAAGQPEKALDNLERLLKVPYYISPAWLTIDPNFDPLRKNPRFQKLVTAGRS